MAITRSIGRPLLSLRSSSRQAAACARISCFGYHLNGTLTSSASCPCARSWRTSSRTWNSAPPCTNGTCASQTSHRIVRIIYRRIYHVACRNVDHVAVGDEVLLAFEPQLAVIAAGGERAAREQPIARHDLGADEPALDVGVNRAGGFLRRRVARNRPRAAFVLADREERDVAEQLVRRANHAIEPGLRAGRDRPETPARRPDRAARSRARSSRRRRPRAAPRLGEKLPSSAERARRLGRARRRLRRD